MKRAPTGEPVGENHHKARLTEDLVRRMRQMHEGLGICMQCVSRLHGVNTQTGYDAMSYRTWKHVR